MIALPIFGYMAEELPYMISLILGALLYVLGSAIYALSTEGWMLLLGITLNGCGVASTATIHTYFGEMSTKLDDIRKKRNKKSIKFVFYIILSFSLNGGIFISFGKFFRWKSTPCNVLGLLSIILINLKQFFYSSHIIYVAVP